MVSRNVCSVLVGGVLLLLCIASVSAAPPVAAFSGTPATGPAPLEVTFTDESTGSPAGWAWFFGDENFEGTWTQQTSAAGWPTPGGTDSVVLPDGSIVLIRADDVWISANNGETWTQQTAAPEWSSGEPHTSVALSDDSIVLTEFAYDSGAGGYGLEAWQSVDNGVSWVQIFDDASGAFHGTNYVIDSVVLADGTILTTQYHLMAGPAWTGVYRSTDKGLTWTGVGTEDWSPRTGFELTAMPDGSVIMTGGENSGTYYNDVWRSADQGTTWIQQTASAGWTPRTGHTCVAMPDGSIVLMGGWGDSIPGRDEIWRSTDNGTTWTLVTLNADWPARTGAASLVMPDGSIVLMGGESEPGIGPYNDVWRLDPTGSTTQNPSHSYTNPGIYRVALQAYNAEGYDSTMKSGYITVTSAPTVTGITPDTGENSGSVAVTDLAGTGFAIGASAVLTPVSIHPVHAGSIINGDGGALLDSPDDVFVNGDYAYVLAADSDSLEIVDITDPTNPVHRGNIALSDSPLNVFVQGNYAYVVLTLNTLEIIDISNPMNPVHAGSISDGDDGAHLQLPVDVVVRGNYAYITSAGSHHLEIVDVSNPAAPSHVGSLEIVSGGTLYPHKINIVGNYAYMNTADGYSIEIVDVSDPANPTPVGSIHNGEGGAHLDYPIEVFVSGNYAYVSSYNDNTLEIIDVSDPANPVHAGSISDGEGGAELLGLRDVCVAGNYAFVTRSPTDGLEIIDVTDPANPVHKASIADGEGGALLSLPVSIIIAGDYAYIASYLSDALEIMDLGTITGTGVAAVSENQITGTFDLTGKAPGTYNVVVTNPEGGGFGALAGGFTVTAAPGSILVTSSPSAVTVTLDDAPLGAVTTPYAIHGLVPGYHHVKVEAAGYQPQEKSVYVVSGGTATVDFLLNPVASPTGFIEVSSNIEGAPIFIDGLPTPYTTPATISGYLDSHSVKLTYPGYFDSQRVVTVPTGDTVSIYIRLDPIPPAYTGWVLDAVKRVSDEEIDNDNSQSIVYSSPDPLPAGTTITLWGVQPPITSPPSETTVVFIDPDPGLNWEHPCSYVFIDAAGEKTVVPAMSPSLDLIVDQVIGIGYDPYGPDLNLIGSGTTPSTGGGLGNLDLSPACTSPACTNNYAVLIDGGYDPASNHIRYWNDISFLYQTLTKVYGYPKDHIRVLMSDGTSDGIDRHNWTFPDGTIRTDNSPRYFDGASSENQVYGRADATQLDAAFDAVPAGADLFVFTTGHGAWDPDYNGGESMLYLWDRQYIHASDFVGMLPAGATSITMVMEQCNSGGFVEKFIPPGYTGAQKRMIATAAAWNQPSKDNGFSSTWTMAAARIDNEMRQATLADLPAGGGDGKISIGEASVYAAANDPYLSVETPQYGESAAGTGNAQFLHTCENVAKTLRLTSPLNGDTWSIGYSNNITWGHTGLGTTTVSISLVNSSKTVAIASGVSVNKRYTLWTPSRTAIRAGNDYQLRITSASPALTDTKNLKLLAYTTAGKLSVNSVPVTGAGIYVDRILKTQKTNTSSILGVSPGEHRVGVKKTGYRDDEVKVYVNSNKYSFANFTLLPPADNPGGDLVVTSSPVVAEVVIDSSPTGLKTPFHLEVPPGEYLVTVQALGYVTPATQTVDVSSNRPGVADFTLEPEEWADTEVYATAGFTAPIDMEGVVNTARAGQTVPVKWHLDSRIGDVTDPLSFVGLRSYPVSCDEYAVLPADTIEQTSSSSGLQYLGDGNWQYNWKTAKSYAGTCRMMYVEFMHGQTSPEAIFKFK